MNLKCIICSDMFIPSAEIYVTPCGHVFHFLCLSQWLERAHSCPHCRAKTTEKTIRRVYFNVEENAEATDFSVLQNKVDNLQFEINLKVKDIKIANDKCKTLKTQNAGLRAEVKTQEQNNRVLESAMHALKEQVVFFKSKAKETEKLQQEIKKLKERLKEVEHVEVAITGSREQVDDMLRYNRDPQSLSVLVSTLKKELIDLDKKKKQLQARLKEAHDESLKVKMDLAKATAQNVQLQKIIDANKYIERTPESTKRKIYKHNTSDADLNTITIAESPSPPNTVRQRDKVNLPSPTFQSVKEIVESDSPYLRVHSTSIGLSTLMNYNTKYQEGASKPFSTKPNHLSLLSKSTSETSRMRKRPSTEMLYDGLGGHSKHDEFPLPKPVKLGVKRPKSTSTITSVKFKKLAPIKQRKLDDFCDDAGL